MEKVPLGVEPERPLDEGTGWVVGRSTETSGGFRGGKGGANAPPFGGE